MPTTSGQGSQGRGKRKDVNSPLDVGIPPSKRPALAAASSAHSATVAASPAPSSSLSSLSCTSVTTRKDSLVQHVKDRDNNVCVISGSQDALDCIAHLSKLWGGTSALWEEAMRDAALTESPANLISLNAHLHVLWRAGRFGLEPISRTDTEVKVRFQWLRRGSRDIQDKVTDVDAAVKDLCGPSGDGSGSGRFFHASGWPIYSGQVFVLSGRTKDERPSVALLQLQWNLVRVAAMAAAADVDAVKWNEDSEEDCNNEGTESIRGDDFDVPCIQLDDDARSPRSL